LQYLRAACLMYLDCFHATERMHPEAAPRQALTVIRSE
jgi:hypothetical protein